jgi:hypothetical protein
MKRFPAFVCFLLSCALAAQTPPSSAGGKFATLQGIVVKEPGSEPVKKTLIELIAESQTDGGNYTALSGGDGSFRIANILPGRYRLFAERTGYQEIVRKHQHSDGRLITLTAGQEIKDFVIHLQAAAVIEGRVSDEDGDPMAEAQITVFRQTFVGGHTHWEQVGAERTNDLGEYRISSLASGQYFASVTPPPDFGSLIETGGNKPLGAAGETEKPANYAYQTTYYPGTLNRAQATPIQLHAGEDFPANFSLTQGPSLTIKGSVTNLPAGASAAITLQSQDFNVVLNGAEMHKDGTFEIRDVSPGAYTIIATVDNASPPMTAHQSLQVAENMDGVRLSPQVGGAIRGRLRIENGAGVRPDAAQISLLLRSSEDTEDALTSLAAQVNADGSFEWKDVVPDRYFIQLSEGSTTTDWFVKSVLAGGRDVSESGLNVGSGTTTPDLIVDTNGASVEGIAINAAGEAFADAVLVAVPEPRFRRLRDHYRKTASDQAGHFRLRGLPPGDYTIFAWESVEGEAYFNPDFMRNFEGQGKAAHLNEGERASLQVKVIPETETE